MVDGRPFALTRHLRAAGRARRPAWACRRLTADDVRRGVAAVLAPSTCRSGRLRITYTGGVAPLGSGPRGQPADPGRRRRHPDSRRRPTTTVVTVPWPRNERGALAGLKTTSYAENVVALAHAARARRHRGGLRQPRRATCARAPARTSSTSSTASCARPTLASGCLAGISRALLLEWYGGREVDEPVEVLADRRRDVPGLHDPRRAGRDALRRPGAGRAGTGDPGVPAGVGRAGGGGRRPVARPAQVRRRRGGARGRPRRAAGCRRCGRRSSAWSGCGTGRRGPGRSPGAAQRRSRSRSPEATTWASAMPQSTREVLGERGAGGEVVHVPVVAVVVGQPRRHRAPGRRGR